MTKVLYIAGSGRSGSTILHNILGQIDGYAAVGELRYVWDRGVVNNWLCGCGRAFGDCQTWSQIMDRAFGGMTPAEGREMADLTEQFRIKDFARTLVPPLGRRRFAELERYITRLGHLYRAIADVTGSRVIVDSSKNPAYGYLLERIDGVEPYYLHFVRDAPAVVYSWGTRREFEPGRLMPRKKAVKAASQWLAHQSTTELFLPPQRRLRLHYEDFTADPRAMVEQITRWVGEAPPSTPFMSSHEAVLSVPNHSVFGNPVRFQQGTVTLRPDERWRQQLTGRDALVTAVLAWPLRARYGYLGARGGAARRHRRRQPTWT